MNLTHAELLKLAYLPSDDGRLLFAVPTGSQYGEVLARLEHIAPKHRYVIESAPLLYQAGDCAVVTLSHMVLQAELEGHKVFASHLENVVQCIQSAMLVSTNGLHAVANMMRAEAAIKRKIK